jgi:predicted ArsR family transcriptional regulator
MLLLTYRPVGVLFAPGKWKAFFAVEGGVPMRSTRWDKRFWASTRGRIVLLLRGGSGTVNELAGALGLTDNAVRTHLTALERDGLVRPSGTRPGTRKPTITYDLTPEAEQQLFPKMYGPILRRLLDVLAERLSPKKRDEIVRAVGQHLAADHRSAVQADSLSGRVAQAVTLLGEWGGFCQSDGQDGKVILRCSDCPLALAAADHPEVCRLLETMLAELVQAPVRERCQTAGAAHCLFEIGGDHG